MNTEQFLQSIELGIISNDWSNLEQWSNRYSSFSFDTDADIDKDFDPPVFDAILAYLQEASFLNAQGSANVLLLFEYDWGRLTEDQQSRLLPVLIQAYPKLRDPLSWFVASELFGRYFRNLPALEGLKLLSNTLPEAPRSLMPMGFEQLIKNGMTEQVRLGADKELLRLEQDPSKQVRMEVEISRGRLTSER